MLTFIPSKTLCKYIQDKNIKFTDSEEATIIYNAGNMRCHDNDIYDLDSKNAALRNLMEQTSDTTLRQQISERLDEDEKIFQKFATDSDDIFYEVQLYDECDDKDDHLFFSSFWNAADWAEKYIKNIPQNELSPYYYITKYKLYKKGDSPTMDEDRCDAPELSYAKFNSLGKMTSLYTYEYKSRWDFNKLKSRFEQQYISLPSPFRSGDIVRNLHNGRYGVIAIGDEESRKIKKAGLTSDFSDTALCVNYLYDDGIFNHDHPYPWELEYTHLLAHSDICSKNIIEAMLCSCSDLSLPGGDPGFLQEYTLKMSILPESELRSAKREIEMRYRHFIHSNEFDSTLTKHFKGIEND